MAEKVRYHELKNPGICAIHNWRQPFTEDEIKRFTKDINKFALVIDGDHLFIEGE